jgi:hypothetical protein
MQNIDYQLVTSSKGSLNKKNASNKLPAFEWMKQKLRSLESV